MTLFAFDPIAEDEPEQVTLMRVLPIYKCRACDGPGASFAVSWTGETSEAICGRCLWMLPPTIVQVAPVILR